jgi:mannose-1-phosphate guanylyltransferase
VEYWSIGFEIFWFDFWQLLGIWSLGFGISEFPTCMITQAFVLGAGLGTRLRPLTEDLPKPAIPIYQKPLITFALDHLFELGIKSFVINTHHLPAKLNRLFPDMTYRGCPVSLVHEPDLLGTGGGIRNVQRQLGDKPFIVYSGDLLTDFDLAPLVAEHFRAGNDVTLALRKTGLATDVALQNSRVVDIGNRHGHTGEYDFANVSVWNSTIFQRIPPGNVSFIPIIGEWIGQGGRIGGVVVDDGKWFNIGSRAEYLEVHRLIKEENWRPRYLPTGDWSRPIAASATINPSTKLTGFYSIGRDCRVGEGAILENTILWPGAQIASRSSLRNCIVRSDQKVEGEHCNSDL